MGGKTTTSTQSVSIPPEVLARYNAVNARAEETAKQPFQNYGGQFVAPLTSTQQAGIQATSAASQLAQPYYQAATQGLQQAGAAGQAATAAAYQPLQQGYAQGQQYGDIAGQLYAQAPSAASPYYQAATQGLGAGLQYAGGLNAPAVEAALTAPYAGAPLQAYGAGAITSAPAQAQNANLAAMRSAMGAQRQAAPYYGAAAGLTGEGSQAVGALTNQQIAAYENPYVASVVAPTLQALQQQQAQERSAQQSQAIRSGAFGGDRAGLERANLARQQALATSQAISPLLSQGYQQAVQTAAAQQGVRSQDLSRALQAGQQFAGLGQGLAGLGLQGAQTLSQLGQTQYGQALGAGQAAAGLGQQLYGQGAQQAQLLSGLGQAGFGQQLQASQQAAQLGQGLSGLGIQTGQALQGLGQQLYGQGAGTAQQAAALAQQGYGMGAGTSQALAGLGTGAQQASLQGAQAQLAAGTAEQQTQQADLTARYQQFLQARGYDFQTAQFLANIAMGTGALSGSTTTSTQPAGFFSDEREKTNIKSLGKGLYAYDYKDDIKHARETGEPMPPKRVGPMAQDIEKKAPGLVIDVDDYKVVRNPDSMGGSVYEPGHYAPGGAVASDDIRSILAAIGQPIAMYGGQNPKGVGTPGATGIVPSANIPVPKLVTAGGLPQQPASGFSQAVATGKQFADLGSMAKTGLVGSAPTQGNPKGEAGLIGGGGKLSGKNVFSELSDFFKSKESASTGGLIVDRHHYEEGGAADPEDNATPYGEDSVNKAQDILGDVVKAGTANEPPKLAQPGQMPKHRTTMDDIKDMASIGKDIAGMYAMSDERMKHNKEQVGELYDGQPVYRYDFGDGKTQLGLMAQNVERRHPEAVAEHRGLKFVDYFQATNDAAHRKGYQAGGSPEPDQRLIESESGGNFAAENREVGAGGLRGHFGRLQFGQARLQDAIRAGALPEGTTPEEFKRSPDLQKAAEKWHFGDIRNFIQEKGLGRAIGTEIGGTPVTEQGLLNVAHLGGKGGLQRFVESEGRYNPADAFGTRLSKYLGLGVGGDQRPRDAVSKGDLPAEGAREAQFRGEGAEKGLSLKDIGEKATSSEFLVPFLSFVGSTLASQRPTLGGALGEGIVGGVSGYQQNRKIQADLAKGVLDMIKDRFTRSIDENNQTIYFDKYTGKRATPNQIESIYAEGLRARNIDPKSFGLGTGFGTASAITPPGAPTAPTAPGAKPAEGVPGEKAPEGAPGQRAQGAKSWMDAPPDKVNLLGKSQTQVEEYVERYADYYGLTDDRNPAKLRAEITADKARAKAIASLGDASQMAEAQSLRQSADEKQKRLDTYVREAAALQVGINAETAKYNTQSIGKHNEDVDKRSENYESARANLVRLSDIYSLYAGNRLSDVKAQLESYFKGTVGYVPSFLQGQTPNYDEALKLALRQAFEIVGEGNLSRAPKASLTEAVQTVPNPSMDPGAVYSLIGRQIGEMDYLMAKDKAWIESGGSMRPSAFNVQYRKDNPNSYNAAVRNAFNEIPVGAKVPKASLDSLRKTYGDFTPGSGKAGEQAQAPAERPAQTAAPAQPVTVRTVDEARALPSGTVFVDPNGVTRRVP